MVVVVVGRHRLDWPLRRIRPEGDSRRRDGPHRSISRAKEWDSTKNSRHRGSTKDYVLGYPSSALTVSTVSILPLELLIWTPANTVRSGQIPARCPTTCKTCLCCATRCGRTSSIDRSTRQEASTLIVVLRDFRRPIRPRPSFQLADHQRKPILLPQHLFCLNRTPYPFPRLSDACMPLRNVL